MLSLEHPLFLGLQQYTTFSESDLHKLMQYFKPISFEKDTIILDIGEINDKLFFVEEGVLQEFSYQEDEEELINTNWLMPEGSFVYSTISFINEVPTEMGIKAIEKVKLLYITKVDLQTVYEEIPQMERIGRLVTEQNLITYEKFLLMIRYRTSEERLNWFEETFPTLVNRVPQKYIASYLNIRPETLSRVRAKRAER
ncbi:MAG: Crp/Fnr family transcriptional regulator [Emticicia sp.]|uniref:Crp/Fnr family transcriptional regulator n=1 Tax=Emticicia sp. TaxID=1930953 RepID=UPI003BA82CA8